MKTIVLSVGGSLICPDDIDTTFLRMLKKLVISLSRNYTVAIYCGGGGLARRYQARARASGKPSPEELDWVGTIATRLNAQLVHSLFGGNAHPKVIYNPTKRINLKKRILVAGGWKPGWSTDYDAVLLAKNLGAKSVVNLTNVDYVYDRNPKKHSDAKPYTQIVWKEFRKIVGTRWSPGLNAPFDPVAAGAAMRLKMTVLVINGSRLTEIRKYLAGKRFVGTLIN